LRRVVPRRGRAARDHRLFRTTTQLRGDRSLPSPVVTCDVRLIGRRRGAGRRYGSPARPPGVEDDRRGAGRSLCAERLQKDNRVLPQTAIDWARVRPSHQGRNFRPKRGIPDEGRRDCAAAGPPVCNSSPNYLRSLDFSIDVFRSLPFVSDIAMLKRDVKLQLTNSGVYRKRFCLHGTRTFSALRRFAIQIYIRSTFTLRL